MASGLVLFCFNIYIFKISVFIRTKNNQDLILIILFKNIKREIGYPKTLLYIYFIYVDYFLLMNHGDELPIRHIYGL